MSKPSIYVSQDQKLTGHKGSIYGLATDPVNNSLLSGGGDGWVVRWPLDNPQTGTLVAEIKDQIFCLAKCADPDLILAGTFSGNLYFIDPSSQDKTNNKSFHEQGVYDLLVFEKTLYTAGGDGKLGVWDLENREVKESIQLSHQRLRSLRLSPDKEMFAIGSSDHSIYLIHRSSGKLIDVIEAAHENSVFTLEFSAEGQFLYSGGRDAHLKAWDLLNKNQLMHDINAHWYTINSLALHPSKPWLASGSRDKTIRIWDIRDFSLLKSLDSTKDHGHINSVNNLNWSDDGRKLFTVSDDRSIIIWDLPDG